MAEIVGLISAIGTIAAAGYKITRAIATACDDFGAATASVKAIAADMTFVTLILGQIRVRINSNRVMDVETTNILVEIVSRCKADIEEVERLLVPLIANTKSGVGVMSKRQRVRWLFAKSKICSQQATLGSLKLTLSLFIHTVQLSDGYNVEELKEKILDAISKSKDTKTSFLHAERIDHAAGRAYGIDASDESNSTEQDSACDVPVLVIDQGNGQTSVGTSLSLSVLSDGAGDEEKGAGDDDDSVNSQLQRLDMSQFDLLQIISDDSFMKIAAHMQLQKAVSAFALVVMDGRPTEYPGPPTSTGTEPTPSSETNGTPYPGRSLDSEWVDRSRSSASASLPSEPSNIEPGVRSTTGSQRGGSDNDAQLPAANDEQSRSFKQHYLRSTRATYPSDGGSESSTTGDPGIPPYGSPPEGIRRPAHQYSRRYSDDRRANPFLTCTPSSPPSLLPPRTRDEFPRLSSSRPVSPRYVSSGPYATSPPIPPPAPNEYRYSAPSEWTEPPRKGTVDAELLAAKQQLEQFKEERAKEEALEQQRELAAKARREAEEIVSRQLQEMELAHTTAVIEIEKAKAEAHQAARERIEEEQRAHEQERRRRKKERELGKAEAKREFEEERERARLKNRVMRALGWDKGAKASPEEVHDPQNNEKQAG